MATGAVKTASALIDRAQHAPGNAHAMNQRHRRAADSGIDPEEFHEALEQFQVAAQDGDLALRHGLGRSETSGNQAADAGARGES
ncbi:MAG TPA: hypothetical protein VGG41_12260 [Solirubrobacteraceae bacterium]|jgi:hypothetical protein